MAGPFEHFNMGQQTDEGHFIYDLGLGPIGGLLGYLGLYAAHGHLANFKKMGVAADLDLFMQKPPPPITYTSYGDWVTEDYLGESVRRTRRGPYKPGPGSGRSIDRVLRTGRYHADLKAARAGKAKDAVDYLYEKHGNQMTKRWGRGRAIRIGGTAVLGRFLKFTALVGSLMIGSELVKSLGEAVGSWQPKTQELPHVEFGGFMHDTYQARTQRQRAIQAIHDSSLSVRSALGNEASFLHS
jgi:hypothetical protein